MSSSLLLSAHYLPSVSYFHVIQKAQLPICIEKYEHYPKQTFRTRTRIGTANGVLQLFVPIQHGRKEHVYIKDVQISYDHDWQRLHWMSIQSAYRSSAYFEYYEDDFRPFFEKKFTYLVDLHMAQLELFLKILKLQHLPVSSSITYEKDPQDQFDYRTLIHPKKETVYPNQKEYYQIFEDRTGFIEDLSIIDLIFNHGPQSKSYL